MGLALQASPMNEKIRLYIMRFFSKFVTLRCFFAGLIHLFTTTIYDRFLF